MTMASAAVVAGLGLLSVPVLAHHGTNISYDRTTTVTIKGVVAEFRYRNPHPALFVDVMDEQGNPTRWTIEIAPTPYTLALRGWSKRRSEEALAPGTPVSLDIYASRAGTPVGLLRGILDEAGVEIFGDDGGTAR
jgi:hypothetical protein